MQTDAAEPAQRGSAAGRAAKLALGVAISAAFLYATIATVPLARVGDLLAQAQPRWILASLVAIAVAYSLKIYRWTLMLRSLGADIGMRQAATPFVGGVAFNNVLPFRAGDVLRVVAFQRFTGVPPSGQVGTLILERLLDLLVLMGILFATISFWEVDFVDEALLGILRIAAVGVVAAILLFIAAPGPIRFVVRWLEAKLPKLRAAGEALIRLSQAVTALTRPLFLIRMIGISALAWLAEGAAFFAIALALGLPPSPQMGLLALSVGTLSTIVPSSPGYVGTFHFFTANVVAAFGVAPALAAAYAILIHAVLWVSTTSCGFALLLLSGFGIRRAKSPDLPASS